MKAVIFLSKDQPLAIKEIGTPVPLEGEVLIRLHYASLNHLDVWIWKEQDLDAPVISGSDGSGVVYAVGKGVDAALIGKEVVINPSMYWGANEKVFSEHYQILGNPTNGTFAEFIAIPQECVYEKPAHLSLKESAALPLAGLTAYRALFTKAQVNQLDNVLITGIGGGAALYLLQMAVAIGASVYVTSSSEEKISKAVELGAKGGFNYRQEGWEEKAKLITGGFDVIIDSAGGSGFALLTQVANQGARIVLFGRTAGNINNLQPGNIYNKQLLIMGTVMGTSKEFAGVIRFYEEHQLHPIIDKEFELEKIEEAYRYMDEGQQFGKVVLKIK